MWLKQMLDRPRRKSGAVGYGYWPVGGVLVVLVIVLYLVEASRLFANTGRRIETVSADGLVTCVRLYELPGGCHAPLAHARLAPASGLDEGRGLPPVRHSRVVP